ncbi:hypothetical protein FEM48_Zijuj01G0295100 [Ziziphus jujuba var. spinosa]|uniref:Transcription repressor n=1 Tax=Ziziphus jujuba var. spinosa TaxID=714518 RepID=A0A978W5R6_ZIZJJ|nr:hypothetical protein FEM48_Zijuj01G0295100 [Ziziphus jujuba var. spinosa]
MHSNQYKPKTLSFAIDRKQHDHQEAREDSDSATLSDIDRLVDPPTDLCGSHRFFVAPVLSSSLIEESRRLSLTTSSSEFDVVVSGGSGSSSSTTSTGTINESASMDSNHATTKEDNIIAKEVSLPDNCIAVLTYSPCPQDEFRRSMHEMIEARLRHHQKVDWVFMEELLFSYLNLNEKKSHKYILSAFVDLIVVLRQRSNDRVQAAARSRNVRSSRERRKKVRQVTFCSFVVFGEISWILWWSCRLLVPWCCGRLQMQPTIADLFFSFFFFKIFPDTENNKNSFA